MDDENQETEVFDTIKMRTTILNGVSDKQQKFKASNNNNNSLEDDLKWVEENVPATLTEAALPGLVDSEEEIANTKFEASKMD